MEMLELLTLSPAITRPATGPLYARKSASFQTDSYKGHGQRLAVTDEEESITGGSKRRCAGYGTVAGI